MEPNYPKRFRAARHVRRRISAALIVFCGAAFVDQTVRAESGTEPAQFSEPIVSPADPGLADGLRIPGMSEELPPGPDVAEEVYPIDLPAALQLAGANNLQIALAAERVNQAAARLAAARAL